MSVSSAIFRPASGLENATIWQKAACTKEKMTSGVKNAALAAGTGILGGITMGGVLKSDTLSGKLAKGFDKIVTPNLKAKAKELFESAATAIKNNPSKTKAAAVIAVPLAIIGTILSVKDIRENAKIEGKHQERVDNTNKNKNA